MISTDGVKQAADDLSLLDSQALADELNRLQSQKFIDPNCHPTPGTTLDISADSFCDNALDGRQRRLDSFLRGLPQLPTLPDQSQCAQATITKLQTLIEKKFSFKTFEVDLQKNKFVEEKLEAQLSLVLFGAGFVHALAAVGAKVPILVDQTRSLLTNVVATLNAITIDEQISMFERQNAVDKLTNAINRLNNIPEDKTVYDVLLVPTARFIEYQNAMLNRFTSPIVISSLGVFKILRKTVKYTQRKSTGEFGSVYQSVGDKMIKSSKPTIDDYYTDLIDGKKALLDSVSNGIIGSSTSGIIKSYAFFTKGTPDVSASGTAHNTLNFLNDACVYLIDLFNAYVNEVPKAPTEKDVFAELGKLDLCGTKLPNVAPAQDPAPDSDNAADLAHNTFDNDNKPTVTDIKYWKRYSNYLTLVNLLPIYWTIGLYIPTPGGILKIPLPTLWRPIFVFNAKPFGLIVIFLTINGIAISPTVWLWKFPPFGKNDSNLIVMLRAFNKKIKDNTGDALLNIPVVNGININPTLTKTLPFKQDDLPTIKRLGLNNPPYLLYLNQWLKQYKTGGGLP